MIDRRKAMQLLELLDANPAVGLLGPRQVGKTTLALEIGESRPAVYLDLESDADRAKLAEPELYLSNFENQLVILDEVHRVPNLFQNLRGLIDRGRRKGSCPWMWCSFGARRVFRTEPGTCQLAAGRLMSGSSLIVAMVSRVM
jgi:predicted AAA+ superfamily ATPase